MGKRWDTPAQKPHEDAAPVLFIYPHEGGRDQRQPSAVRWSGSDGYQAMRLRMVLRRSPKSFTIEDRIPGTGMWDIRGKPGASWKIAVRYQNVAEIYHTMWQGIVTLRP